MNKYLLFANDKYYPLHGMYGCKLITDDFEQLVNHAYQYSRVYDYVQYYDMELNITFNWDANRGGVEEKWFKW